MNARDTLCRELFFLLSELGQTPPVVLCIGTDRIIGDSLGPLTGSILLRSRPLPVYGTLEAPVHALNLEKNLEKIKKKHPRSPVIAVDASLGSSCEIGKISVRPGSLSPGSGVSKALPRAGDIAITGITGKDGSQPYLALQTARLSLVASMAETIAVCIAGAWAMLYPERARATAPYAPPAPAEALPRQYTPDPLPPERRWQSGLL